MADYLPKFEAAKPFTLAASSAVTGGRVLIASGVGTVSHSTDDAAGVVGVAGFDAAKDENVTVYPRPGVHRLTASGAITAGAQVVAAAAGKVQTIASKTNPIGVALTAAADDGDVIDVLMV